MKYKIGDRVKVNNSVRKGRFKHFIGIIIKSGHWVDWHVQFKCKRIWYFDEKELDKWSNINQQMEFAFMSEKD